MRLSRSTFALLSMTCLFGCGAGSAPPSHAPSSGAVLRAGTGGSVQMRAEEPEPRGADGPITPALRAETIDRLLRALDEKYVFPDKVPRVRAAVAARAKQAEYGAVLTGQALAAALTRDINEVLKDAHFRVRFSLEKIPEDHLSGEPTREEIAQYAAESRRANGGIERVERLPGNIGYLEVRSFGFLERGGEAVAAAMSFLSETEALIIDLRRNGGGEPDMVAVLCSYLFPKPVHLNDIYFRPQNETRQFWTSTSVPGKRYLDRDVYVLIGRHTASGAEEFAYNLKQLRRGTLVGETTWGGANPGDEVRLSDHFVAFVPSGRAINPITKTNWEGTGVEPDLKVPADDALRIVQIKLIEQQLARVSEPGLKDALARRLRELSKK